MRCRACPEWKSRVLETRRVDGAIWRRRECLACGNVAWTSERYTPTAPQAIHRQSHGVRGSLIIRPKTLEEETGALARVLRNGTPA